MYRFYRAIQLTTRTRKLAEFWSPSVLLSRESIHAYIQRTLVTSRRQTLQTTSRRPLVTSRRRLVTSRRSLKTSPTLRDTVDEEEVRNFEEHARGMWSERGEYELLHLMNRVRIPLILEGMLGSTNVRENKARPLERKSILDVGCGGGILSEPLARLGANVTGIDASGTSIHVARRHADSDPIIRDKVEYICDDITNIRGCKYDAVVASEVVEHVSDVDLFLDGCCRLVKPGGSLFITTINRTRLSYLLTIALAENVLGLVPRGIHDWNKYQKPEDIKRKLSTLGLATTIVRGMTYNPVVKRWSWVEDTSVNYVLHAVKMGMEFPEGEKDDCDGQ